MSSVRPAASGGRADHQLARIVRLISGALLHGRWLMKTGREYADRRNASALRAKSHRADFYGRVWREAAEALGAEARVVGREILEITLGDRRTRVLGNVTMADDPVTLRLANDKTTVHRLLSTQGLPVPEHVEFTLKSLEHAERFMKRVRGLCVVKAARATGAGQGVTTGIRTRSQLENAALQAAVYSAELLIEREVPGRVYRLLFAGGRLIDTVRRNRPTVVGNGRSTVRELVTEENDSRLRQGEGAQALLHIDLDMKVTLARQALSMRFIPADGVDIVVKSVTNDNAPRDNESANDVLCEPILDACRQAIDTIGLRLAGVDVVTADPSKPLQVTGGVILEVNASPGYHYHYYRRDVGAAVAVPILAMLLGVDRATASPSVPWLPSGTRLNRGRAS